MKNLIFAIPFLLFACGNDTEVIKQDAEIIIAKEDIKTDKKIELEIEGMTCEMGCVSTIRNRVNQMKGSTNFEMDFDTERATDFATVSFDSRALSAEDIKTEIQSIAQGLYSVLNITELPID
jgi:Cu+-exporting ATPase